VVSTTTRSRSRVASAAVWCATDKLSWSNGLVAKPINLPENPTMHVNAG